MLRKIKYTIKQFKEMTNKVYERTWKNKMFIFFDMLWCAIRYGASPRNYFVMSFYKLYKNQRKTFVTHRISAKLQRTCNDERYVHYFRDKIKFYEKFKDFMGRSAKKSTEITNIEDLKSIGSKIIVKPLMGAQGQGIKVFELNQDNVHDVFKEIKELPESSVETFLEQHEELNQFCDVAVNIIRVVTGRNKKGFKAITAIAAVSRKEPVANGSCDALMINVDVNQGVFTSGGIDLFTNIVYEYHPISNKKIKGFKIPYWKETIEMLEKASLVVPEVGYVGWDVAITPSGPVIIEGNNDGGYDALQLLQLEPSGIGKKAECSFLLKK